MYIKIKQTIYRPCTMNVAKLTFFFLIAALTLVACKKAPVNKPATSTGSDLSVDVYTTGSINYATAAYWKNGTEIKLADSGLYAGANALTVSGNDIYVTGYTPGGSNNRFMAASWKNGVPEIITTHCLIF